VCVFVTSFNNSYHQIKKKQCVLNIANCNTGAFYQLQSILFIEFIDCSVMFYLMLAMAIQICTKPFTKCIAQPISYIDTSVRNLINRIRMIDWKIIDWNTKTNLYNAFLNNYFPISFTFRVFVLISCFFLSTSYTLCIVDRFILHMV